MLIPADPSTNSSNSTAAGELHFQLIQFNWEDVETPYMVASWLLLASIAKILFHVHKKFGETVPDSALLIFLGFAVGGFFRLFNVDHRIYMLQSHTFFYYLLPPIIFDAGNAYFNKFGHFQGFFMPNRLLFDNFDSVLLFAFVGTIWNTFSIGFSLLWLAQFGCFSIQFSQFQILLFASLISAVDPVAVIAVFEEIHINEFLFINVFGEALFNDGVSVVLYKMFSEFLLIGPTNVDAFDYFQALLSFLLIALGGVIIGVLFAVFACILTKHTQHLRILAPVFIFVVPYMSYMTAELFGLSSILAIIACGIFMKQYIKGNLTHDAYSSVKYFVKMLAQSSETVIFMFLGLSTFSGDLVWDWAFVGATIAFCLLYRVIGVVVQCAVLNRFRSKHFSCSDQFVLSYGGLRGAIAFGLVISTIQFPARQMFITTTLAVIFFTVFVQGISIRPLLFWLKVEKQQMQVDKAESMGEKIFGRFWDYTMAGVEEIAGQRGKHYQRDTFERFNAKILKPALMRDEQRKPFDASPIIRAYTKITLQEALKLAQNSTKIAKKAKKITRVKSQTYLPTIMRTTSRGGGDQQPAEDLDEILSNRENVEFLYSLFSRLLDRKIEEVRAKENEEMAEMEDDIQDDAYLGIVGHQQPKQTGNGPSKLGISKLMRRESTSPGQLCVQNAQIMRRNVPRRLSHPSNCSTMGKGQQKGGELIFQIGNGKGEENDELARNGHLNGNGLAKNGRGSEDEKKLERRINDSPV